MKPESFIRKLQPDADGLDFEGLRKEGLALVQKTCGDVWSDYNLHDPGVTILEQLCYGLTDLAYRSGFSAADYLALEDGRIDFDRQGLYRPDRIFCCRPLTGDDYRKLILSSVPNIDNVWIPQHIGKAGEAEGLHHIHVLLGDRVKDQANDGVRKAYADIVGKLYAANRNLCEDLGAVHIVERIPYSLAGEIEVEGKREPASILAEIYYECARYLNPRVVIHSRAEHYKNGDEMEALFTGIESEHGYIPDEELQAWRGHFSISELLGTIGRIEGVGNIRSLFFVDDKNNRSDSIDLGNEHLFTSVACLHFPPPDDARMITLYRGNRPDSIDVHDVAMEFERLGYKYHALQQRKQHFDWVGAALPAATFRNAGEYFSLQNHFPDVYGLNSHGVPDSAAAERKAQARQLKAYLLLFEQLMANFLQGVQEIPRLFSLDAQLGHSYFHQVLRDEAVPAVEELYQCGIAQMDAQLSGLVAGVDNYGDRRNRVLDYLLALYGEKFSQVSLRHFYAADTEPDETMIRNKIAFLKDMVSLGRDRAGASNYRKPAGDDNNAGLKNKLRLLLGRSGQDRDGDDLQLLEHILLRPEGEPVHGGHGMVDGTFYSFRVSVIFPACAGGFSGTGFRKLAEETVYMNCPAHVHPQMFWLEPDRLQHFNALHENWLEARRGTDPARIDAASGELIVFLLGMQEAAHG